MGFPRMSCADGRLCVALEELICWLVCTEKTTRDFATKKTQPTDDRGSSHIRTDQCLCRC
jgi:hypothetical protein